VTRVWRVPQYTTVHLQKSKKFTTLSSYDSRKENMQIKERSAARTFNGAACVLVWHGDHGNHVLYLTIQSVTDIVQNFRN